MFKKKISADEAKNNTFRYSIGFSEDCMLPSLPVMHFAFHRIRFSFGIHGEIRNLWLAYMERYLNILIQISSLWYLVKGLPQVSS